MANMNVGKNSPSICKSRTALYTVGEFGKSSPITIIEMYEVIHDKWSMLPSMSVERYRCAIVIWRESWLYAI